MNSTDIRVIFLYEYKLGNNAAKAARNINQAFGENTVNDRKVQRWFEKLKIIRPSLVNRHGPILLHDNARPHTSYKTIAKLNELKYEILQHPAYSPDLSPTDFHFFKYLEQFLRAKQYENEDSLKNSISEFIDSKDQNFFKTGIYALKSRWEKCIEANGAYFD